MSKKSKLRKQLARRDAADAVALVICTGKKCAPRAQSEALAAFCEERVAGTGIKLVTVNCLHVCKKGPIAATYPKIKFKKRVDEARAEKLIGKLRKRSEAAE